MALHQTIDDARQSLADHGVAKGREIHQKYGPQLAWEDLLRLLKDRAYVRYPCEIVFDAGPLLPGEFAYPLPKGTRPEDGFAMHVHPVFGTQLDRAVWLVLYQLVVVNYGACASADEAESFGAAALGVGKDDYYKALCEMAEQL
ncbi:MAG TPA: hypothetical protein VN578_21920 [Candidatus Binatia bacterium]|jgi:hypothetical protein|nr:hypothetical protein [Candidatus Binatia bacterium]